MSSQQRVSPDQKMRPEYVDNLVASDLVDGMYDEDDLPQPILDLLHKDFPLANIRGDDREHFRLLADNIKILVQELFAPEGSRMTGVVGQALLEDPVLDRLPTAGRLVRLRLAYGDKRLEAACARALAFGDPTYRTVKGILRTGAENQPLADMIQPSPAKTFVRSPEELFGTNLGGETWN